MCSRAGRLRCTREILRGLTSAQDDGGFGGFCDGDDQAIGDE
jgi:hypothetical protein